MDVGKERHVKKFMTLNRRSKVIYECKKTSMASAFLLEGGHAQTKMEGKGRQKRDLYANTCLDRTLGKNTACSSRTKG